LDSISVVDPEKADGGASGWREGMNFCAELLEMPVPLIASGMKKPHEFAGFRIE